MDRFRFRIWDYKDKCYKYSFDLTDGVYELSHCFNGISSNEESTMYPIDKGDFEQSTGLRDKNGKLIYEGDIVKEILIDEESAMGRVFEEVSVVCFGGGDYPYSFTLKHPRFYRGYALLNHGYMRQEIEVIGNIHENPELMDNKEIGKGEL